MFELPSGEEVLGVRSWPPPSTPARPGLPPPLPEPDLWEPGRGRTVVIGGGVSGMAVGMDLPGEVILLEADVQLGGRARWSGGRMFFPFSETAVAAGYTGTVEELLEDWEVLTGEPPTAVTEAFLRDSEGVHDRLVSLGLGLGIAEEEPILHRWPHLSASGGGSGLVGAMAAALPAHVEVRVETPATALLVDDGRVLGVQVGEEVLPAERVVLATGGFVNRLDLLERVLPDEPGTYSTGTDLGAMGQALDWADAYGFATERLEAIGFNTDVVAVLSADDARPIGFRGGAPWVYVDAEAERFVDESATWSILMGGLRRRTGTVWALSTWELLSGKVARADSKDLEAARTDDRMVRCRDDLASLAGALGVNEDKLAETAAAVERYRSGAEADPHGRPGESFESLDGEPCAYVPGYLAAKNFGGLRVDPDGRVYGGDGRVVEGLWAVGEAAGMGAPGMGGATGFDGSLAAVVWSGWRTAAAIQAEAARAE